MDNLNWVDYVAIGIFAFSIFSGLIRGLVREVLGLVTLVAAFVVATMFADNVAASFTHSAAVQGAVGQAADSANVSIVAIGLSFALIFAGTVIVGSIITFLINLALTSGVLGFGNRLLGAVFGAVKAFIITLVLIFVVQLTTVGDEEFWHKSQFVQQLQPAVEQLGSYVSPSLANLKAKFEETIKHDSSASPAISTPTIPARQ